MEAHIHDDILKTEDIIKMIDAEYYEEMPVRSAEESFYYPVKRTIGKRIKFN